MKTERRKSSLSSENDGATNHWGSAIKAVRLWPSVNPRTISRAGSTSSEAKGSPQMHSVTNLHHGSNLALMSLMLLMSSSYH